jgi:hypothetical protein
MVRDGGASNLKHHYRVLDVPWDASPRAIRSSYRKLVKRWHPDRYRLGSDAYAESGLMTKLINESYDRIKNAPLQNGAAGTLSPETSSCPDRREEPDASGRSHSEYVPRDPNWEAAEYYKVLERARQAAARDDATRPFDWVGFLVRFVLGAAFGAFVSFRVMISLYQEPPKVIYLAVFITVVLCALASGFGGDAFWRAIRPGGVWWWHRWD